MTAGERTILSAAPPATRLRGDVRTPTVTAADGWGRPNQACNSSATP